MIWGVVLGEDDLPWIGSAVWSFDLRRFLRMHHRARCLGMITIAFALSWTKRRPKGTRSDCALFRFPRFRVMLILSRLSMDSWLAHLWDYELWARNVSEPNTALLRPSCLFFPTHTPNESRRDCKTLWLNSPPLYNSSSFHFFRTLTWLELQGCRMQHCVPVQYFFRYTNRADRSLHS